MGKFPGVRRVSLLARFSIITFALLLQVNFAAAGSIGPNQGFDFVMLFPKQTINVDITQAAPFGIHTVGVLSFYNLKMRALCLTFPPTQNAQGLWFIMLSNFAYTPTDREFSYGSVSKDEGHGLEVKTNPKIGLSYTMSGAILTSPVSAESPYKYRISFEGVPSY